MQYQIREPQNFAGMLISAMEQDKIPELPFIRKLEILMKYRIEKNTVQETLIIPLYARKVCS